MSAEQLLTHVNKLPTVPKVVHELMTSFQEEDVETARIAGLIETDPVISAKVLRMANSAYFHRSRSIGSISDAVMHLGFERVRNLVVGCGLVGSMQTPPGMDKPTFWRHAVYTAVASRELARLGSESGPSEAHALGPADGVVQTGRGRTPLHAGSRRGRTQPVGLRLCIDQRAAGRTLAFSR